MLDLHTADTPTDDDIEADDDLPCAETLLVAALALMTQHAQADTDDAQRRQIGRKIDSTLFFLTAHPGLSPAFRTVLGNLRASLAG